MQKSHELFLGLTPMGTEGMIVDTLVRISYGQTPLESRAEFEAAVREWNKRKFRATKTAMEFRKHVSLLKHIVGGKNANSHERIHEKLSDRGYTLGRIKHVTAVAVRNYSEVGERELRQRLPFSHGQFVVILAKDKAGRWRLFA